MVLAAKLLISVLCLILGIALSSSNKLLYSSERQFRYSIISIWFLTRVGLFVLVYVVLAIPPQSDVTGYYFPQGLLATRGAWVYRDFTSSYAPLFPYAIAAAMKLWHSSKIIVLLAIFAEAVSLPLWFSAASRLLPALDARRGAILYVASAIPLLNVALEGQNQIWVSPLLAAALCLYIRNRPWVSGIVISISIVLVKFLALLAFPALFFWNRRRAAFAVALAIIPALVYGFLVLNHVDILVPIKSESGNWSSGNLPFLGAAILGLMKISLPSAAYDGIAILCLGALCLYLWRLRPSNPAAPIFAIALLLLTLELLSKKAHTGYLVMAFYPICLSASHRITRWKHSFLFGLFGAISSIERTLWYGYLHNRQIMAAFSHATDIRSVGFVAIFVVVDLSLIASYVWIWLIARSQLTAVSVQCSSPVANDLNNLSAREHYA